MKRLYFLIPDVGDAKKVVDELLLARVEEKHIHVIAKEGTPMEDLPEAGLMEEGDFYPALEKGVAIGGVTGALAGLVAVTFPPADIVLGGGAILATALVSAGLGGWLSTMIGVDVPNTRIEKFKKAIEEGELLMMVDVPKKRVDEIEGLVKKCHPKVEIHGTEATIPSFP